MADTSALVEQLSGLTVLEVAGLVKQLEEKWGVSAAAPVAVAAALEHALASHRLAGPDAVSASVAEVSWGPAQQTVLRAIEQQCGIQPEAVQPAGERT